MVQCSLIKSLETKKKMCSNKLKLNKKRSPEEMALELDLLASGKVHINFDRKRENEA